MIAEEFWREAKKAAPNARCIQKCGNHDDRPKKRLAEQLPELLDWVKPGMDAIFKFDGVETQNDAREEFEHNGVLYHHGHSTFGKHYLYNNKCTVNGHLHRGAVEYKQTAEGMIWELNAGCGIDANAPVFTYHSQKRMHGITLGLGYVDKYGPRFMPYEERR